MAFENKRDQSEFNMAVSYLNRLNTLFYVANEASIQLDLYTWFHTLMVLFRELSTEMKPEEIKEHELELNAMNNMMAIYLKKVNMGRQGVNHGLHQRLHRFEIELRRVVKESGLQTKILDEAAKALR